MKWSLIDETRISADETQKDAESAAGHFVAGGTEPSVIPAPEPESSNLEVEPQSTYLAPLRRTPWKFNSDVVSIKIPRKHSGFRIAIIITLITALAGAGTAYIILKTALADTVINKYLDHQITSGLVGHWTFDGQDMTRTTALDRSGSNNTGTINNMATSSRVLGKMAQALNFDAINDYVNAGSASSLDDVQQMTISAWIKPETFGTALSGPIVSKGQWSFIACGSAADCQTNRLTFTIGFTVGGNAKWSTVNNVIKQNQWQHVTVTYDRSSVANDAKFYINGERISSSESLAPVGVAGSEASDPLLIGYDANLTRYFDGPIDDFRLYNRILSQKEIKRLYKLGEGTKINTSPTTIVDDGLVGYWTFDGQNMFGNSAYDLSSTHATGTLTNMASSSRVMGKHGQAIQFDGVDDYINAGSIASLDNIPRISITAWIRPSSLSGATIVDKDNGQLNFTACADGCGPVPSNNLQFSRWFSVSVGAWKTEQNSIRLNEWQHVAVTYDNTSTANAPVFYVNGIATTSTVSFAPSGTLSSDASGDLLIGKNGSALFPGILDDVRIYNRVLSADEIQKLYKAGEGVTITADPFVPPATFTCGTDTVTDADANVYNTLQIGSQCWMKQNMRVGTRIAVAGNQTNNATVEKYCYDDTDANCTVNNPNQPDGGLYQWNEAMQHSTTTTRGICPSGWHIPTHDEFTTLERAICTSGSCVTDFPYDTTTTLWRGTTEGTKLKANGTSLFEANRAGRSFSNAFLYWGSGGYFWSSSESGTDAWYRYVHFANAQVYRHSAVKTYGLSVRCLKD